MLYDDYVHPDHDHLNFIRARRVSHPRATVGG